MSDFIQVISGQNQRVYINKRKIVAIIERDQKVQIRLETSEIPIEVNQTYNEFIVWLEKEMSK